MAKTTMSGRTSVSRSNNMHDGLRNKSPKGVDASMTCKGGSVNSETTRGGVAPTPKTIGPRTA